MVLTAVVVGAAATAVPLVARFAPSEQALVMGAAVRVDRADIASGAGKTVGWRGKPVWIRRRPPEMLASLAALDSQLVDTAFKVNSQQPDCAQNAHRSIKPEFMVSVGICTHLGCSPTAAPAGSSNPSVGADWPSGFYCPCHGSTFDLAGRVFKNKPTPTNLEVPPHRYLTEGRLLIGDDQQA